MKHLTILICTHNRAELLERVLQSINTAERPASWSVRVMVAANACTDTTHDFLQRYQQQQSARGWMPLDWFAEPTPGKSYALNAAIPRIKASDMVAFVDDDHRVDGRYLVEICRAADDHPEMEIFCGRILPDWTGQEPAWVHDNGPYKIYPLPIPRYDLGDKSREITLKTGPIPGGGNIALRGRVFDLAGNFSTELGPHGHDLGGGEDSEYFSRALRLGATLRYSPGMIQYHWIDLERLKLGYLMRKAYQRTRSVSRIRHNSSRVPLFMWRKIAEYAWSSLISLSWQKRRFYLVRSAAALGEMKGAREAIQSGVAAQTVTNSKSPALYLGVLLLIAGTGLLDYAGFPDQHILLPALAGSLLVTLAVTAQSLLNFSQTGPRIRDEVLYHYKKYTVWAVSRLALWALLLTMIIATGGIVLYAASCLWLGLNYSVGVAFSIALASIAGAAGLQFLRMLLRNPGLLVASMHYRASRLYPLWRRLTPRRLLILQGLVVSAIAVIVLGASWSLTGAGSVPELAAIWASVMFYGGLVLWNSRRAEPASIPARQDGTKPNIIMIGSDTLRADRIRPDLTPNIHRLAQRGIHFTHCYVPCARTAPSLISLLTGTWPHTHGVRDNFVADADTDLSVSALPQWLAGMGYHCAAISDWCGADMGKFNFGFHHLDLPEDQWNLKFLIRQGPKDLRLFLSLFLHNDLGRLVLPELYYLGGVPLSSQIGRRARHLTAQLAARPEPFFLNCFYSTTHPPFASEYPWYIKYADPSYDGASKFAMARLNDPFDIIRRQAEPREEFDLDQILKLYNGSVAQFDHEVGLMLDYLEKAGLADNTIVVIYSDHGMEFFEHATWGQGNSVIGEVSPRIPFILADPRRGQAMTVSEITRSIDIAPTLVELAGGAAPASIDGMSLAPLMHNPGVSLNLPAFNETGIWLTDVPGLPDDHLRYPGVLDIIEIPDIASGTLALKPEYEELILRAKDRMVRRGKWKLIYQPTRQSYTLQLFDVQADPECRRNRYREEPEIAAQLWALLKEWIEADPKLNLEY